MAEDIYLNDKTYYLTPEDNEKIISLNNEFFCILHAGKFAIIQEAINYLTNEPVLYFTTVLDQYYSDPNNELNLTYYTALKKLKRKEKIHLFKLWLHHPDRRSYRGFLWDATKNFSTHFNLSSYDAATINKIERRFNCKIIKNY